MAGLKLHTSNKLEILSDILSEQLIEQKKDPLIPDIIMVQSRGMEKWLSLRLAWKIGIWANFKYYLPNSFIHEFFKILIPGLKDTRYFDTDLMVWRIFNSIQKCKTKPGFEEIKNYLKDNDELKMLQLSTRLANLYDQYLTFRPDMILKWDKGKEIYWQEQLWRVITEDMSEKHPPALREKFFKEIRKIDNSKKKEFPSRISIFGISYLPRFHMEIITALSTVCDINMYLLNPSKEFWTDIKSEHDIAKIIHKKNINGLTAESYHLDTGNNLLASMGKLGKNFNDYLFNNDIELIENFSDPGDSSILKMIQSDIFNILNRGVDAEKIIFSINDFYNDNSISINSCHSPMREIEILFDYLIDLFNNDAELLPNDIIVMTPDIDEYAPYIQAVFSAPENIDYRIPFSIADRNFSKDNKTINAFFSIIDLSMSRFEATSIINILEYEDVRSKFDITSDDIELITKWIRDTNICWGLNENDRRDLNLPEFNENSWEMGLNRLILGYAMSDVEQQMFCGIFPYDKIEGDQAFVLGKFLNFFNNLITVVKLLKKSFTLKEWGDNLKKIPDTFILEHVKNENSLNRIVNLINKLNNFETESGFNNKISCSVIRNFIKNSLQHEDRRGIFLSGGITFCTLLPMRSIPFKIVCMVGMNNADFPRISKVTGFDLIARDPRPGDRSLRDEDRYLFLESLLSAGEYLYLSYIGQGIDDNSTIPPSILVSELIDYIVQGFEIPKFDISSLIIKKHGLQGFSESYFKEENNLFSYSSENYLAYLAKQEKKSKPGKFINNKLSETYENNPHIFLDDLINFFQNPARFLLNKRLGIKLFDENDIISDREPFNVSGLQLYNIKEELLKLFLKEEPLDLQYRVLKSKGILPHGNIGLSIFNNIITEVEQFGMIVKHFRSGEESEPVNIDIDLEGYRITGKIKNIFKSKHINYRCAKSKGKDRLKTWILHNLLNFSKNGNSPLESTLINNDGIWDMKFNNGNEQVLRTIINTYNKGNNELISFFPESSLAFIEDYRKRESTEYALKKAEEKWVGSYNMPAEKENLYLNLCYGDFNPFDKEFIKVAQEIYEPMIDGQVKVNHGKI